ncbi:hypothetical protein PN462_14110, partial [Spirulina sp. CS-785/01]
ARRENRGERIEKKLQTSHFSFLTPAPPSPPTPPSPHPPTLLCSSIVNYEHFLLPCYITEQL